MSDKLKSKKFWISLAGAAIMLLQLLGVRIDVPYVSEIISSICAACVLVGLLEAPKEESKEENEFADIVGSEDETPKINDSDDEDDFD